MVKHIINLITNRFNIYDYFLLLSYIFYILYILKNIESLKASKKLIFKVKNMYNFAFILFCYFLIEYWVIQSNLIVLFPLGIVYLLGELTIKKTNKADESNMNISGTTLTDIRENYPYSFNLILSILTSITIVAFFDFLFLGEKYLWIKVLAIFILTMILYITSIIERKIAKKGNLSKKKKIKEETLLKEIKNYLDEDMILLEDYIINGETDKAIKFVKIQKTIKSNEMFKLEVSLDSINKKIIFEIKDYDDNIKHTDIINYDV